MGQSSLSSIQCITPRNSNTQYTKPLAPSNKQSQPSAFRISSKLLQTSLSFFFQNNKNHSTIYWVSYLINHHANLICRSTTVSVGCTTLYNELSIYSTSNFQLITDNIILLNCKNLLMQINLIQHSDMLNQFSHNRNSRKLYKLHTCNAFISQPKW